MAGIGIGRGFGFGKPSPKPRKQPPAVSGGLQQPPTLTFDPAIEAQRRAAQRGLGDLEHDVGIERKQTHQNLSQALRDIHTKASRGRQDLNRNLNRGEQRVGFEEQDTRTKAARTGADLSTRLTDIGRQFTELGHRQAEGANAAGVNDAGTNEAAAAARSRNQGLAEAPIHVAQERLGEDLRTALERSGVARDQLGQDYGTGIGRLKADRERDRRLSRQDSGRQLHGLYDKLQRGRREAAISNVDLLTSEIYQARQNRPGAFTKTGAKQNPAARRKH